VFYVIAFPMKFLLTNTLGAAVSQSFGARDLCIPVLCIRIGILVVIILCVVTNSFIITGYYNSRSPKEYRHHKKKDAPYTIRDTGYY